MEDDIKFVNSFGSFAQKGHQEGASGALVACSNMRVLFAIVKPLVTSLEEVEDTLGSTISETAGGIRDRYSVRRK